MSVTTTQNPINSSVQAILTDYELHHSGSLEPQLAPLNPRDAPTSQSNPASWPTDHRRVPAYRPINRNLDPEQRPAGLNGGEAVFIFTMLNGVRINSMMSTAWRHTGGKINNKLFHYEIGGEW